MRAIQQGNLYYDWVPAKEHRMLDYRRAYTLVVDLPDYTFFKDLLRQTDPTEINKVQLDIKIGLSVVNPIDQFCRKEGLKKALEKLIELQVTIDEITILKSGDFLVNLSLVNHKRDIDVIIGCRGGRALIDSDFYTSAMDLNMMLYGRGD